MFYGRVAVSNLTGSIVLHESQKNYPEGCLLRNPTQFRQEGLIMCNCVCASVN